MTYRNCRKQSTTLEHIHSWGSTQDKRMHCTRLEIHNLHYCLNDRHSFQILRPWRQTPKSNVGYSSEKHFFNLVWFAVWIPDPIVLVAPGWLFISADRNAVLIQRNWHRIRIDRIHWRVHWVRRVVRGVNAVSRRVLAFSLVSWRKNLEITKKLARYFSPRSW